MTRRTFIAFLTALLPANWLRPKRETPPDWTQFYPGCKVYKVTSTSASPDDWIWMKPIRHDGPITNGYSEVPTITISGCSGPGLCDLAYRKP